MNRSLNNREGDLEASLRMNFSKEKPGDYIILNKDVAKNPFFVDRIFLGLDRGWLMAYEPENKEKGTAYFRLTEKGKRRFYEKEED